MEILKLDIDGRLDWKRIRSVIEMFNLDVDFARSSISSTLHGYHIYLGINSNTKIDDRELCFMQAVMGSDWRREILNWMRITRGAAWQKRNWNVLFMKKFSVDLATGRRKLSSKERVLCTSTLERRLDAKRRS